MMYRQKTHPKQGMDQWVVMSHKTKFYTISDFTLPVIFKNYYLMS